MITQYQRFALNHFLTTWPEAESIGEIRDLFDDEEALGDVVEIWEPFAHHDPDEIFEMIEEMAAQLEMYFEFRGEK